MYPYRKAFVATGIICKSLLNSFMEEDKSIFNVEVNETGREHIRRIHKLTTGIFWGTIIFNLVVIGIQAERQIRFWKARVHTINSSGVDALRTLFYPVSLLLVAICNFFFWFYFLRFTRRTKDSLVSTNPLLYNDSFRWLYRSLVFGIIWLGLNAIEFVLAWYFYF